jgi:PKD repeat protein
MTGGGVPTGLYQVCTIDTNLTTMTGAHITSSQNGDHDENLMALDPSGNFMYTNFNYPAPYSADFTSNNEMHKVPLPGFTPGSWVNAGPIYHFTELGSIPYVGAYASLKSRINMFNGMVCGNGFLYTYNGDTLKQWNKATGAMIKQVVTGGKVYWSGGLDLDLCENVYAGVSNKVNEYDANLNLINTYTLSDTSCYDLKIDTKRNLLYACGNGYVSTSTIVNCTPCTASITGDTIICAGQNTTLTASGGATYSWNTGGSTTYIIVSPSTNTTYTVTASTGTCIATATVTVNVNPSPTAAFSPAINGSTVTLADGSTSAQGAITTWSWSCPEGNPSTASSQNPMVTYTATGTYTVCLTVISSNGCMDSTCQAINVTVVTSVNEPGLFSSINSSPNPTNGVFQIQITGDRGSQYKVEIYNLLGEKIYNSIICSLKSIIDISTQPSGVYFLNVKTEKGFIAQKLIIQK